jgi:hypothetical protein
LRIPDESISCPWLALTKRNPIGVSAALLQF